MVSQPQNLYYFSLKGVIIQWVNVSDYDLIYWISDVNMLLDESKRHYYESHKWISWLKIYQKILRYFLNN